MTDTEFWEQYERAQAAGASYLLDSEGHMWQIVSPGHAKIEMIGTWSEYEGLRQQPPG